jgi:ABC-type multidrug transport system ATPase subunit
VKDIEYVFTTGDIGLNQMSFSEVSGKIVGIMGASGSGKSTLLKILNGSNKPSKGSVTINGISIHENRESIKGLIGFVPQEDLLIEDLTVFDNLYFNAKLCFDNLTNDEIIGKVDETLRNVGLFERKWEKVGTILNPIISGGQRKRLNIALELIRKPEVLFLDEPTSGLSSNDSANILDLLTDLSKEGKLVFVVIHQPSDEIFRMFDKLIILDSSGTYYSDDKEEAKDSEKIIHTENNVKEEETKTSDKSLITVPAYESIEIETAEEIVGTVKNKYQGGYMIYCGHPLDAIEHFKRLSNTVNYSENECYVCHNVDPNHIFSLVEARILGNDGQPSAMRKTLPNQWNASFKKVDQPDNTARSLTDTFIPHVDFMVPGKIKQTIIFIWRDIKTKISDSQYIIITLLEAPVLAFLLSFLIKYFVRDDQESGYIFMNNKNLPVYLFMSVIVAVFMGMIISADEIIKNKKLLKRESFLNLSWGSFLISKVFVLFLISGIQTLLFVLVGNSMMEIKGMMLKYWLVLFSCWGSSVLIGLLISDSFKSVATIYIVVPFLVIPQILLSGIIVKYDNLNPIVSTPVSIPFYGEMITARWGFEALAVNQFVHNDFEEKVYKFDKVLSKARYIKIYWHNMIRGKLDKVENAFNNGLINSEFEKNLEVIRNEFENDITDGSFPKFELTDSLYPDRITSQIIVSAIEYVENLERNYNFFDNEISKKKEYVLNKIDLKDKNALSNLKMTYFNTSLEELVTNSKELTNRIIEYKGRLYQKYDQIYQDPSGKFLKAQFYTPTKQLFGYYIDTYYMNIVIIWFMTALIYIALYFRILRRILDYLEGHSKKKLDKGLKI